MLTIFKRDESPYWQIRGTVRFGRKIKTINKKSTGRTNKREAQKVCDEINREILLDFDKQNYMTWSECLKKMRKNPKHCPAAYRESIFSRVESIVGNHLLNEFNDDLVFEYCYKTYPVLKKWEGKQLRNLDYEEKQEASSKHSTANNFIGIISKVVHYGFKQGYCNDPTFEHFPVLNAQQRKKSKFSMEEITKIENECKDWDVLFLFIFLIYTGVRISEALNMNWNKKNPENNRPMIDLEKNQFNFYLFKTNEWKTKPIHEYIHKYLKQINYREGQLFEWSSLNNDRASSSNGLKHRWKIMLENCGIKHKNRHSCRHTHASMIVDGGASLPELMKSIGWRSTKVALGYINSDDNKIANLVTSLPIPKQ